MENGEPPFLVRRERVGAVEIVRLVDAVRETEVCLAPSIGSMAYAFTVKGKNLLWFPFADADALRAQPIFCGIPFLAPWANRLDGDAYWFGGKQYLLNPSLGNVRRDSHQKPIHGVLNFSDAWELMACGAGARSAFATTRLEFWRHPDLIAQFPFAHTITVTYRLEEGALAVETSLENRGAVPMPVAIGYHPYFQLHDSPRDEWKVHLSAREHLLLDGNLIPTGAREPLPFENPHRLQAGQLDDVFGNLVRDADGFARFRVEGKKERIEVAYGPKYPVAIVYAPNGKNYICFEPMSAVTNAFNLAHAGVYPELQTVSPGGEWREIFRISASGFF